MEPDRLKAIDLFSSLTDEELERVAGMADELAIEEGEELVSAGTSPYQLFAIEEGAVEITHDGETLATLGPGEVVGEQGVVERGLRNASAVATSPVRAIYLTADQVRALRRDLPELDKKLQSILEERGE